MSIAHSLTFANIVEGKVNKALKMSSSNANPPPEYFTSLARNYARQTGNSTRAIFASSLDLIASSITSSAVIHDNAGGVGTATSVILDSFVSTSQDGIPEVLITDNSPAMVAAACEAFKGLSPRITAVQIDSQDLSSISDGRFTLSILNFSVFLFPNALAAIREIHRTLQANGVAALLTWKRFGFGSVIHVAQTIVRPGLPVIPLPGTQFLNEGVLAKLVVEAGFDETKTQVVQKETVRTGEDVQGMKEFMLTEFSTMATKGWSDEEKKRWPAAVEQAIRKEVEEYGGIRFEAWVVIARK